MRLLSKKLTNKRVARNIEFGLYWNFGKHYVAVAKEVDADADSEHCFAYTLSFSDEEMPEVPAFHIIKVDTLPELIAEMRKIEPDLRKWRLKCQII